MRRLRRTIRATVYGVLAALPVLAAERFPQPDFESGYTYPPHGIPPLGRTGLEWLDVLALAAALGTAAWLVTRRRSRRGVVVLMLVCLAYFGFWKRGCVCAVGAFQNVARALADSGTAIPLTVLLTFLLPLAGALFFGRVFCAAVCPLGAAQDLVAARPIRLPRWLNAALGLLPVAVLSFGWLLAATGTAYAVCRFDPLVPLFRIRYGSPLILVSLAVLIAGIWIARPYCRFLCPYGVLLAWFSRLSRTHMTITPDECVQCHLCPDSCPFDAIEPPSPKRYHEPFASGRRRFALLVVLVPVLAVAGGVLGRPLAAAFAPMHIHVQLADQFDAEDADPGLEPTVASRYYRAGGRKPADMQQAAETIRRRLRGGGTWAGAFVGLVAGLRLLGASLRRRRTDYVPNRGTCLSCGRCFLSCPREHARRGWIGSGSEDTAASSDAVATQQQEAP